MALVKNLGTGKEIRLDFKQNRFEFLFKVMILEEIHYFMREAIKEGQKALPVCLPNPPIGCVIVADGKIIARGHTNKPGSDHAEAMALNLLPKETKDLTFFVTLEPCSYHGRTPSCAKTMLNYPVKKVYVGTIDPHPKNQGAGIKILTDANIEVETAVLEKEVLESIETYLFHDF